MRGVCERNVPQPQLDWPLALTEMVTRGHSRTPRAGWLDDAWMSSWERCHRPPRASCPARRDSDRLARDPLTF